MTAGASRPAEMSVLLLLMGAPSGFVDAGSTWLYDTAGHTPVTAAVTGV